MLFVKDSIAAIAFQLLELAVALALLLLFLAVLKLKRAVVSLLVSSFLIALPELGLAPDVGFRLYPVLHTPFPR